MRLTRFEDAAAFLHRAEGFLLEHEAEHNLMLGLCASLLQQPAPDDAAPYLALVEEGGTVVAAALRTPPHNLVLSRLAATAPEAEALALIAADAHALYGELPGVLAPSAVSLAFATCWHALTGRPHHIGARERIYELEAVIPVSGVPGRLRPATAADHAVLVDWIDAFFTEALGGPEGAGPEKWVDAALASPVRGLYLWEDSEPAAFASWAGPTPHGIRIGPVYTPPERRGHGYASACVAALSQLLLDQGRRYCFLFTDLSNPTANHIYQTIGYQPVSDAALYRFAG